jgi:alanine racemase
MIYRKTYAIVDLEKIYHNYLEVSNIVSPRIVMPVVKANAYGHGVLEVVDYLYNRGVDHYCVSLYEEALELKEKFMDIKVLVMGSVNPEDFFDVASNDITITISNMDQIEQIKYFEMPITVHMKVDTGMNRLGFKTNEEIMYAFEVLRDSGYVNLEGIYTHFSTADCDQEYYDMQRRRFDEIIAMLDYNFRMVHASNSSSSIKYENGIDYTTHVRLGISLYGLTLDEGMDFLQPAMTLVSHINEIKHLKKGEKVGYGATYEAQGNEIIGVLPIGYADGFIRKNQGGKVEINGSLYDIVGRICMDQMFVKIDASVTKSDDVILMGGMVSIDDVAQRLDTINYEVTCMVSYRVPRIYIKGVME